MIERDLSEIAAALRAGEVTAAELAGEAGANHDRHGAALDGYIAWDPDGAAKQAQSADAAFAAGADLGPLQGMPISAKDMYAVAGFPTHAGSAKPLPPRWEEDGPMIAGIRRQGAIFTGKSHTVEFAFGGLGNNSHWGTPRNPWDAVNHRVPGGSSSGAGISLKEGSAVVALGTDTAGSVRIPASMTGNVGLKVTAGRWPTEGIVPLSSTFDTPGILVRSVADAAYAFAAIDPSTQSPEELARRMDGLDPGSLRLGMGDDFFWEDCFPGVAEGAKSAIDEIVAKGARLTEIDLPHAREAHDLLVMGGLAGAECYAFVRAELPEWLQIMDPNVARRMADGGGITAVEYLHRRARFAAFAADAEARLRHVDVLVTPTVACTPPTLAELEEHGGYRLYNLLALRNTGTVNLMGLCALSMPVALDAADMPVGLQLIARAGAEEHLLAVATAFESVLGKPEARIGTPPLCRN